MHIAKLNTKAAVDFIQAMRKYLYQVRDEKWDSESDGERFGDPLQEDVYQYVFETPENQNDPLFLGIFIFLMKNGHRAEHIKMALEPEVTNQTNEEVRTFTSEQLQRSYEQALQDPRAQIIRH
jgi:hypothetical protein